MDEQNGALNSISQQSSGIGSKIIFLLFKYIIPFACLVWVFYDIHFEKFWQHISAINWGWVAIAVFFDILSYICQGVRWELLLRPIGRLSWIKTTQAIYAGLFANEVLPMRFGELVRAYLVSRWISIDFVTIIPSLAVERLFDGLWLAFSVGVMAIFFPLPKDIIDGAEILGIIVLIATVFFIFVVVREERILEKNLDQKSYKWKPIRLVASFIEHLAVGLKNIGLSRPVYAAFFYSLFVLAFQAVSFWLVMVAYGINLSVWQGTVVFLIVHLGTVIPNAPSNIGTYQFFTVVGLSLFGIEKTLATGFSVIVFLILTLPLWFIGLIAIIKSGATFNTIRQEIGKLLIELKTESKDRK